jgi:hypothetical protein
MPHMLEIDALDEDCFMYRGSEGTDGALLWEIALAYAISQKGTKRRL